MEVPAPGAPPVPASLRLAAEKVDARLAEILDRERRRWTAFAADLAGSLDALGRLLLGGGKRLRPAFVYWGHAAAGGDPDDRRVADAGAAFELLHAFALIHDDVMDGSSRRRGLPTAHVELIGRHASDGWRGESRRFGEGVAVLVGDLAHVYADRLLVEFPREALEIWNELRVELMVGQLLDMYGTARADTDHDAARLIARYKSGKYTIERPLHLGAALAGRLAPLAATLSDYGDPLGEAFQLRDDLLGAFGDPERTGKPVGDDLREGKPTPLLTLALERAGPGSADLVARIGHPDLTDDEIAALQLLLEETGARADIEASIEALTVRAIGAVTTATTLPAGAAEALVELAEFVGRRDR